MTRQIFLLEKAGTPNVQNERVGDVQGFYPLHEVISSEVPASERIKDMQTPKGFVYFYNITDTFNNGYQFESEALTFIE